MTKLKPHRFATIFPLIDSDELHALADDIKINGLRRPIVIFNGEILDGRNRLRACEIAGVEPTFETFDGDDSAALRLVTSENLTRRHLSVSQRSMIAARIRSLILGDNQHTDGVSQVEAANQLNVSRRAAQTAAKVVEKGVPELAALVDSGAVAVSAAAAVADLPADRQAEVVAAGPDEIRKVAAEVRAPKPQTSDDQPVADRGFLTLARALSEVDASLKALASVTLTDQQRHLAKQAAAKLHELGDSLAGIVADSAKTLAAQAV